MSKIEKALKKAKENSLSVIPIHSRESKKDNADLEVENREGYPDDSSSRTIKCMNEPFQLTQEQLREKNIIYPEMKDNRIMQAFREMRTKLLHRSNAKNGIVMVTSVAEGHGSSFVATNLGSAFALDGGKTALVIDCNLSSPGLESLIPADNHYGLTDYLVDETVELDEIIHAVGIPRLRIMPAGSKREIPAEHFTSIRMKRLLDHIYQRYSDRFIIIDAPPIMESADTKILAELCDGVLLVIPYGKLTENRIMAAVKEIGENKFLGAVFNDDLQMPSW